MELEYEPTLECAHVRFSSQEAVVQALLRLGVCRGAALAVWPPKPLPGPDWAWVFLSPVRDGWVSLWSGQPNLREWLPQLSATLECPAVYLAAMDDEFWMAEFLRDGLRVGRCELPTQAWEEVILQEWALETLEEQPDAAPEPPDERVAARMEEIEESEEYREQRDARLAARPRPEQLAPFLPAHADTTRAWELLTAIDRHQDEAELDEDEYPDALPYMEGFATYLGIHDATWDHAADAETVLAGDYDDEEDLPAGWRDFVALPATHIPVL
jgi:hypothetical protein